MSQQVAGIDVSALAFWMRQFMPDTAIVKRLTKTHTSSGGYTESWTDVVVTVGRVKSRNLNTDERRFGDQLHSVAEWMIVLPADTDVKEQDRILIKGELFDVVSLLTPKTWEVTRRVLASTVTGEDQ